MCFPSLLSSVHLIIQPAPSPWSGSEASKMDAGVNLFIELNPPSTLLPCSNFSLLFRFRPSFISPPRHLVLLFRGWLLSLFSSDRSGSHKRENTRKRRSRALAALKRGFFLLLLLEGAIPTNAPSFRPSCLPHSGTSHALLQRKLKLARA